MERPQERSIAAGRFDVLVTMDRGIVHQQNVASLSLALVQLHAPSNRFEDLLPLLPALLDLLPRLTPGAVRTLP